MEGVNTGLCSNRWLNQEGQGVFPAGPPLTIHRLFEERALKGGKRVSAHWSENQGHCDEVSGFSLKKKIVLCDVAFDTNINLHEK